MPEGNPEETGFSKEYVEKLRREAADWRTKYRRLESQSEISAELSKRGLIAEPDWVQVGDDMSVKDAVENFAAKYPHLKQGNGSNSLPTQTTSSTSNSAPQEPSTSNRPNYPSAESNNASSNTNVPTDPMKGRSLKEIKQDPVARDGLREKYRQLIQEGSRQSSSV